MIYGESLLKDAKKKFYIINCKTKKVEIVILSKDFKEIIIDNGSRNKMYLLGNEKMINIDIVSKNN